MGVKSKVLITGASGFIGKNLIIRLGEIECLEALTFTRENEINELPDLIRQVDFIFHLAGINRPNDPQDFLIGNSSLTRELCDAVLKVYECYGIKIPIIYSSSTQAECQNLYGQSKLSAEKYLFELREKYDFPVYIYRLPNVFGKWGKPNYNSVISTFCHNIARGIPININSPKSELTLVYVDDLVDHFIRLISGGEIIFDENGYVVLSPLYSTTVGEIAELIESFSNSYRTLMTERVGVGLVRALYATYMSYLPPMKFSYEIPAHTDQRGVFVEVLKTYDSGQFGYFTIRPGFTRGGHYHHTKSEKFLVVKGAAHFKFLDVLTNERHDIFVSDAVSRIVETAPGWTHEISNIGKEEVIVIVWASEVFNRARPDTIAKEL